MQRLGMPGGRFAIVLHPGDSAEPQANGLESVEFLVSANPGQPLKGLARSPRAANCRGSAWRSR